MPPVTDVQTPIPAQHATVVTLTPAAQRAARSPAEQAGGGSAGGGATGGWLVGAGDAGGIGDGDEGLGGVEGGEGSEIWLQASGGLLVPCKVLHSWREGVTKSKDAARSSMSTGRAIEQGEWGGRSIDECKRRLLAEQIRSSSPT